MHLRGAPLIGVAAAYGMYLAALEAARGAGPEHLHEAARRLVATRPTAVNLAWAVRRQLGRAGRSRAGPATWSLRPPGPAHRPAIEEEDVERCRRIGEHGRPLLEEDPGPQGGPRAAREPAHPLQRRLAGLRAPRHGHLADLRRPPGRTSRCTSGSTRPARATRAPGSPPGSWSSAGVPHTVIVDNAGGHLMQRGPGGPGDRGGRPGEPPRGRGQQDRHLPQGPGRARQRHPLLRGAAHLDHRLVAIRRRSAGNPHRGARRAGGALRGGAWPAGSRRRCW